MGRLNSAQIIGNLCRDPEIRTFQNGDKVANLRAATNERWKDRETGETRERAEYHSVTVTGGLVKVVERYIKKGDLVYFAGKLRTRKWTHSDGSDRYSTEIVVDGFGGVIEMLGSPRGGGDGGGPGNRSGNGSGGGYGDQRNPPPSRDLDDEIPF